MGRSLDDVVAALPKKRRRRINTRFNKLLAEELDGKKSNRMAYIISVSMVIFIGALSIGLIIIW